MKKLSTEIESFIEQGFSYRKIGKILNVHHSTISYRMRTENANARDSELFVKEGECRICILCGREYIKDRKKGHKGSICNSCCRKKLEISRRNEIKNIAGSKCCRCGYHKCENAIDYHHIHSENKDISISQATRKSYQDSIKEIYKCIPLCANCHREWHSGLFQYEELIKELLKPYQQKLIGGEIWQTQPAL